MTQPDKSYFDRYRRQMAALAGLLLRPTLGDEIRTTGETFSQTIRTCIGPDGLKESARRRFIDGQIDVDELELELGRIDREFGSYG